ncbi:hypothetical protein [Geomonas oryzae]|uniref:hypothetical protein n=1 Tax=Geomonas oryzae TaxID=2364273 RepID=UPI00100A8B36|nr:hypothetical protein [Geomonas oryzae]
MLLLFFYFMFMFGGCGSDSLDALPVGYDIVAKYNLSVVGGPTKYSVTLPQQINDANWGLKEILCQEAGFSLIEFSGQEISMIQYHLSDLYWGQPLDLIVLASGETTVCGYLSLRDSAQVPGLLGLNRLNL